jgi:hypothetical protein
VQRQNSRDCEERERRSNPDYLPAEAFWIASLRSQ